MKLKKILASILCAAMVLSTMSFSAFAEDTTVIPVEVTNYNELITALAEDNANIIMMNDITATATQETGYGKAGIVVGKGDVLNGNGHKLTINGANDTWDCAVAIMGGTVKNLTIAGAMRGAFMPGANGDVVIDNCKIDNVCYTFNSDAGSKDYTVTVKNTVLNGWTSFSDVHKSVTFDNCTFGKGTGGYQYEFCRPYQATTFNGCDFEKGYKLDTSIPADNSLVFTECKYDGEPISAENGIEMFYNKGNIIIDGEESKLVADPVASVGLSTFATLEEALDLLIDHPFICIENDEGIFEGILTRRAILKELQDQVKTKKEEETNKGV